METVTGQLDKNGNAIISDGEFFVWIQYRRGEESRLVGLTVTRKLPIEFVPSIVRVLEIRDSVSSGNAPLSTGP